MRGRARARPSRPTDALNAGVRQPSPTSVNGIGRSTYRLTAVRPARAFMSPPQRRPSPAPPAVNSDGQAHNYPAYSTGQYPAGAYRWQLQQNQYGGQAVRHPAAYHRAAGVYGHPYGRQPPRPTGARAVAGAVVQRHRSRKRSLSFTLSDTASVARSGGADSSDTKRQRASDESPAKRARRVSDDVTAAGDAAAGDGAGRLSLEDINVDSLQPSLDHDVNQDIDKVPTYRAPSSSSAAALSMEEFSLDLPDSSSAAATAKQNGGRGGATSALNDHDVVQLIDSDDGDDDRLSLDDSVVEGDEHDLELLRSISASGGDAGSSEADDSSSVDVTSRLGESALLYFIVYYTILYLY